MTLLYDGTTGTFSGPCGDVDYLGHLQNKLNWTEVNFVQLASR